MGTELGTTEGIMAGLRVGTVLGGEVGGTDGSVPGCAVGRTTAGEIVFLVGGTSLGGDSEGECVPTFGGPGGIGLEGGSVGELVSTFGSSVGNGVPGRVVGDPGLVVGEPSGSDVGSHFSLSVDEGLPPLLPLLLLP